MAVGNSSASRPKGCHMGKEITPSVKIFLGVFIILLALIGVIGNTIVIIVLRIKNIFTRKATSLILTSLAAVDLLGSMVDIPLAFGIMVASLPDEQLYRLSLAKVVIGPLFFLGYITCFFLLSLDRNDALRKTSNRPALFTPKRLVIVLTLSLIFGIAMSLLFVFKSEDPSPLVPLRMEPRLLTVIRAVLFLVFVIAFFSNIYFYLKIRRLIKNHSENGAAGFSQVQRENWQVKERRVSWTVIQLILVVCLSYIPYTVTSIIFLNADIVDMRVLNAVAVCRSLTYLKYAVNAFVFTRLDGKFLRVFVDIFRRFHSNKRKIVAKSPSRGVHSKKKEEHPDAAKVGDIT
ncbi:histamine H2 receptor-like [Orbicella faveolata]|uniref:histamine H2 receptor-like n=1 Tax=Orbicella faveolata TaxID=48498 RepID=UPI0009E250DA|nr:histamine H2 receptor-like [Orbicella faveolata]